MASVPRKTRTRQPIECRLPCHDTVIVKVTARPSKQQARPRRHKCHDCGREYDISASKDQITNCKEV